MKNEKQPELVIMIGPAGSGKTTYAATKKRITKISFDEYKRKMFGSSEYQYSNKYLYSIGYKSNQIHNMTKKERITACNNALFAKIKRDIEKQLKNNRNVLYDAPNITKKSRKEIINIGKDVAFISAIYMKTPIEICLKNNINRMKSVPADVIYHQFDHMEAPEKDEGFSKIMEVRWSDVLQ